jgi:hypothetical protein
MVSQPLTQPPRPQDKLPSTLKKPPMPGEKDPPQALDQSTHMDFPKEEVSHLFKVLMIEIKDTITHTQT